ncbi:hypothetical protein [Brevibacillus marinus]|uniref:hypothetical protein n=1 Tax=Brevibacillus marinus TaxID=2496837 RepID=UPI000F81E02A|nr:hypothetical protein [Brevibacillus marinus]
MKKRLVSLAVSAMLVLSIGEIIHEVSISFEWPDGGDAELSTNLVRGEEGYYSITVEEDNWVNALPGKFQINFAAFLKSRGTYLVVDVSNKIWTNSGVYENDTFETEEEIRNDY